jgi:hypothetical protein
MLKLPLLVWGIILLVGILLFLFSLSRRERSLVGISRFQSNAECRPSEASLGASLGIMIAIVGFLGAALKVTTF